MRLIQNMSTIAEFATPECPSNGNIKIAVIGGSGVGKTGTLKNNLDLPTVFRFTVWTCSFMLTAFEKCIWTIWLMLWSSSLPALVVRFLTRRFIGDYERNAGNLYSREVQVDGGEQVAIQVQDTPGVDVSSRSAFCYTNSFKIRSLCLNWTLETSACVPTNQHHLGLVFYLGLASDQCRVFEVWGFRNRSLVNPTTN